MEPASRKYIASRSTNNEEQQVTTGESKEQESLLPPLWQCMFLLLLRARTGPICRGRVLIKMVDNGINSGSYLYDLLWTNEGGRRSATETTKKLYKLTSDRNSLNVSILTEKRLKHKWV